MEIENLWRVVLLSIVISILIVIVSRMVVQRKIQVDKVQSYECGFQPFSLVLGEFDVQFYVVALLFLLFDVELMLLFPWSVIFVGIPILSFYVCLVFLIILVVGMVYEWVIGGLEFSR